MGFAILPLIVLLFFIGIEAQTGQLALAVSGAGLAGRMSNMAAVDAQQAEVFDTACESAALASPGLISASIVVVPPPGVLIPAGAVCMTNSAGGGVRNVYSYTPAVPGEAGQLSADTQQSAVWYQVKTQGQAVSVDTGLASAVPATIPAHSLLSWMQVNP